MASSLGSGPSTAPRRTKASVTISAAWQSAAL